MSEGTTIWRANTVFLLASGCVTLIVCWLLRMFPESAVVPVFCRVPAELAAGYYNAGLQRPELLFAVNGITFAVERSCAATDFFSMVTGLLTYLCLRLRRPALALAILPAAWGVTLLANTVRLIFLVPATAWVYRSLPERTFALSHQAIGTLVFLTLFIILWEGVHYVTRNATR